MLRKISKQTYLLLIILIIASFFRLYNLSGTNSAPPGLYPDEAINGNNASEALNTGEFKVFYPENNGREGLFINIQAVSIKIFGNTPLALRLPSAIIGILTVLGIYLFCAALFNNASIGLLSAFFTAISFWHINFSRIGFRAIMAPFFLVWALYLLISAIKRNDTVNKSLNADHPSWLLAAFGGLAYGAGFYTYIAYRATPLLILIIFLVYWFKNNRRQEVLEVFRIFALFTFIAILPLAAYFVQNPQDFIGHASQLSISNSASPLKDLGGNILKTAGMFNFSGDTNWRHNFSGKPELYWPVGITFLFGIFYGLKNLLQKTNREFILLFSWIIIAAIPVVISNEGMPHALRSILMIPPVFILAGAGAFKMYELLINKIPGFYHRHDKLVKNAFILICALLITQAYNYYFVQWGNNPNVEYGFRQSYVDIGEMLNTLPKETMKYVVVEKSDVMVRGIPMPAQTVMFITDTFTIKKQAEKNIHYLLPGQEKDRSENNALFFYLK
ncbi:MAG: glycosyltransferase family 39 protein [bacterium]|nr:glycosyltransferase family 39 protein [bacterium]